MNCRDREHDIILFLYDELPEADQSELRRHLESCAGCREFTEAERQIHARLTDDFSEWTMPSDLLVECRRDLSEALDGVDARHHWWRAPTRLFNVRWLEAVAMVSIGLALGVYVSSESVEPVVTTDVESASTEYSSPATVTNLRIVDADPVSGQIQLAGESVSPVRFEGKLEDQQIRDILATALTAGNAGERLRIVNLLAPSARESDVQEALIRSVLHDENQGVRWYALQALKPLAADENVRSALMYVLENDEIPGLRVAAIDALAPLTQDEATAEVVQEVTRADPNSYIRNRALQFVVGR
jgi:HEAT repeats/Putative zinc-finger